MRIDESNADNLDEAVGLLRAVADPVRLRLLHLLASEGDEVCVCHLYRALDLPQSTVSRHLATLRRRGLVSARKDGPWAHYRLAGGAGDLHRRLVGWIEAGLDRAGVLALDRERLGRERSACRVDAPAP